MEKYKIKVLGNDKEMYTVDDFVAAGKTHKDAIGIVFGTPIIGLRILAFDSWKEQWGNTNKVLTECHNEPQVVQILYGMEDTRRIVEAQKQLDRMTAAKWCWNYKKGDFQWYLPSMMELGALFLVRDQMNEAMKQLDCDDNCLLPTEDSDNICVWSSTEDSQYHCWGVNFSYGYFYNGNGKNNAHVVRPVAAFSQPSSPSLFSGEAKSKGGEMSDKELVSMLRKRGYSGTLTKNLIV